MKAATDIPPRVPRAAERIFDVACELFYREGTRAVGVEEIVTKAAATKPSLYRSFQSKDELVAAYLRDRADRFWMLFDESVASHPGDPKRQLLSVFEGMARRTETPDYRGCGLTNALIEYPEPAHPARQVSVAHKAELRSRLQGMCADMGATSPDDLGDSLLLLMEGARVAGQTFGAGGPAGGVHRTAAVLIDAALA